MKVTSKQATHDAQNPLKTLQSLFTASPILFRNKVVKECNWSVPTFYRKIRDGNSLSNAEKDKILQIALEQIKDQQLAYSDLALDPKRHE